MESNHHIVLKPLQSGWGSSHGWEFATLDELRWRGWKPTGDVRGLILESLRHQDGGVVSGTFAEWDADGREVYVSEQGYPTTTSFVAR